MKTTNAFEIGGGLGDSIQWANREQFSQSHEPGFEFDVYGFKQKFPIVGDFLIGKFERQGELKFQFTAIKPCNDPSDMFFAKVVFVGPNT